MKRVKEARNLAFNHMSNLCDFCKRCKGFRKDNDIVYDCKYNTNQKGLFSGFLKDHLRNYKCKYFKRHQKYCTCDFTSKNYSRGNKHIMQTVKYIRGKFHITTTKK